MASRAAVVSVCWVAVVIPGTTASEGTGETARVLFQVEPRVASAAPHPSLVLTRDDWGTQPWISPSMWQRNREQVVASFRIALDRVREISACAELFTKLGADGRTTLARIVFHPLGHHELRSDVCRGNVAYTLVGGGPVWLCRRFSRLSDSQAAIIIIHEALHHAGLTEWPRDPDGMTSAAIDAMIATCCNL